jgi:hypothetical protein
MASAEIPETLAATRDSWHRVAEHVISPARHAVTGRIGLRPAPGGFATPPFGDDGRTVGVDGVDLVVTDRGGQRRTALTTLRAAAAFVGVEAGAPTQVYTPSTPLELDAPLPVDPAAATVLAGWYALGADALARFAAAIAEDSPSEAQLWPEHFDLGIAAAGVNYGVSQGDEHVNEPYLYVGPHEPVDDPFFDQPFGATRTIRDIASAEDAVAFFTEGHARTGQQRRTS